MVSLNSIIIIPNQLLWKAVKSTMLYLIVSFLPPMKYWLTLLHYSSSKVHSQFHSAGTNTHSGAQSGTWFHAHGRTQTTSGTRTSHSAGIRWPQRPLRTARNPAPLKNPCIPTHSHFGGTQFNSAGTQTHSGRPTLEPKSRSERYTLYCTRSFAYLLVHSYMSDGFVEGVYECYISVI